MAPQTSVSFAKRTLTVGLEAPSRSRPATGIGGYVVVVVGAGDEAYGAGKTETAPSRLPDRSRLQSSVARPESRRFKRPSSVARSATRGRNAHPVRRTIGIIEAATIEYPTWRFARNGAAYTSG